MLSAKMGRVTGLTMIWESWARAQCYLLFPAVTLYATMAPLPTNRSEYCCCPQLANWVKKYQSGGIQNWRYIKDKLENPPCVYLLLLYAALCLGNIFFELRPLEVEKLVRNLICSLKKVPEQEQGLRKPSKTGLCQPT